VTPSPSPSPGVWGMAAGNPLAPDLFTTTTGNQPRFGPWAMADSTITIKSCKRATGAARGQNCLDASFVPVNEPTELQGNFKMRVRSTHAISGQPQERTKEFLVSLLAPAPTHTPSSDGANVIYSYAVSACASGTSAATPTQTTATSDEALCNKLCYQPLTYTDGTSKNGCWDATTRRCDLSHQICNALDIPRMADGKCDFTALVRRVLLKEPSTPGTSRDLQPVACWWDGLPGLPAFPNGGGSTGLPILMNNVGTYRNQLLCKSDRDGESGFFSGDPNCDSCARRANTSRDSCVPQQEQQCISDCGNLGLTAWINRHPVLTSYNPTCTCGAPLAGLDLCKRDQVCGQCSSNRY
jgi:hypothetical protein